MPKVHLFTARSVDEFATGEKMFLEYATSLGFSLCFQGFDQELKVLDQMYGPPSGSLFLLYVDHEIAGCGGIRHFDNHCAELKRMYIKPEWRGNGFGQQLLDAAIKAAKELGYRSIRLDTLPTMTAAIELYRKNGFDILPLSHEGDLAGTIYMLLKLEVV